MTVGTAASESTTYQTIIAFMLSSLLPKLTTRCPRCRPAQVTLSNLMRSRRLPHTVDLPARRFSTQSPRHASGPRYVRFNVDPEKPLDVRRWDWTMQVLVAVVVGGGVYYVMQCVPYSSSFNLPI